jgi:hypothetical protein
MVCFAATGPCDGDRRHYRRLAHTPAKAPVIGDVPAPTAGTIAAIDGEALGWWWSIWVVGGWSKVTGSTHVLA